MSKLYVNELVPRDASVITAPNLQLPAGSVVQVVNASKISNIIWFGLTTGVYTQFLSATITPKYANSSLVIIWHQNFNKGVTASNEIVLRKNGSTISVNEWTNVTGRFNASGVSYTSAGGTSAITFTLEGAQGGGTTDTNLYAVNNPNGQGMTIMEIAQ